MGHNRREFLREGALLTVAGLSGAQTFLQSADESAVQKQQADKERDATVLPSTVRRGDMLYRQLGRTGDEVSLIGLGGFHIGKQKDEAESISLIRSAIDRGITFMDNCWDYNNGASEVRMGKALQGGRRDKVFLMSKIDGRTAESATNQIDQSLQRLQTDRIDLMQFHEIIRLEDPDRIFANDGAFEALAAAQKAGKVRHIGFTGHKDPIVHLRMLDVAAQHGCCFDAVQMPINVMDAHFRSFQNDVLPRLVRESIGVLAMKTFGDHFILDHVTKSGTAQPIELLHYSMSLPVSVVITGIDSMKVLDQAIEAARTFEPLTSSQKTSLLNRIKTAAMDGKHERFKTSNNFDGTAHHPEWLG